MGIPHLYKWLKNKRYKGVLRKNVPNYVSSFSLDANGIIHKCAQITYAYGEFKDARREKLIQQADPRLLEVEFHNVLSAKLHEIIMQVQPQEILLIAIDGVAPQAKIAQQRQRRFKSALEKNSKTVFDSNCISPGTEFMIRLDNFIQRWLISNQEMLPSKVIYSSHMVPGEGEHIIMDLIRSGEISGEGAHVLYGMDADLIMLSLMAPINRISLMREDISDIIDIDSMKEFLLEELELPESVHDFVVILFTIGNDFLPHMPSTGNLNKSIELMLELYKRLKIPLTNKNGLDWDNILTFLTELSKLEPDLLREEASRDVKYPSRMLTAASQRTEKMVSQGDGYGNVVITTDFDYNVFRAAWYQNALNPRGDTSIISSLIPNYNMGVTMNKVIDMCQQYLTGMAWVYTYYTQGPQNINTAYVYKYHHTPLLSDISIVLSQIKQPEGYLSSPDQVVLNPIHQLLAILPLKSKELLPHEVKHLMTKDSPIFDMYPENVVIEMDGKNADWEGVAIIPFIEPYRIIEAVNNTTIFTADRVKLYTQANNIVMLRNQDINELNSQKRELMAFLQKQKQRKQYQKKRRDFPQKPYQKTQQTYQKPYQKPHQTYQKPYQKPHQKQGFPDTQFSNRRGAGFDPSKSKLPSYMPSEVTNIARVPDAKNIVREPRKTIL